VTKQVANPSFVLGACFLVLGSYNHLLFERPNGLLTITIIDQIKKN